MKIATNALYARIKSNIYFGAVSINKDSGNNTTNLIKKAEEEVKKLSYKADFQLTKDRNTEIELQINNERDERLKPWYAQWFQEGKINNELVKKETTLKQENNAEQQKALEEAKEATKEIVQIVDGLQEEISENDKLRATRIAERKNIKIGEYRTNKGFSQIAGYDKEKEILYRYFISEIAKEKSGEDANIPGAVLFFGPKGNGKTTFATAFAQEIGSEPIKVRAFGKDTFSICEKFYSNLYKAANKTKGNYDTVENIQVIFIDEIDKYADEKSTIIPELEDFIKTCYDKYHCIVFAATNYPLKLNFNLNDDKLFPFIVSQDPPTKENKKEILKYYLKDKLQGNITDEDYDSLVQLMEERESELDSKYSIARIREGICDGDKDNILTLEEVINNIKSTKSEKAPNIGSIQLEDYIIAMNKIMKNVVEE